jgi:ubiquinone/menaquinone biosynthesis C-methylase UbiE
LDIGCGTGAFCYALNEHDYNVTGIDVAPSMIKQAKEYTRKVKINFIVDDVLTILDFKNKSFDIVISSYVAHGMNKADRKKLYQESARLAKDMIIFHDYNMKRSLITDIAEWLEGGDYFNFINIAESEMREYFGKVKVINVRKSAAWYIIVM